jgi:ribosomal protein L15
LIRDTAKAVKILNSGSLSKKLSFSGILTTKGALEKIKAVGGEMK